MYRYSQKSAFTLIEVAIAIVVVALAYVGFQTSKKLISQSESLVALNQADNNWEGASENSEEVEEEVEHILPITSGLVLWLDASDTDTITTGATFTWADKSSAGNDVTQTSSSRFPVTNVATINGRNVLDFDGEDDFLIRSGTIIARNNGNFTKFMVLQKDDAHWAALFCQCSSAGDTNHYSASPTTTAFFNDEWRPGGGGGTGGAALTNGESYIATFARQNWSGRIYQNGSLVSTGATESYSGSSSLNSYIAVRINGSTQRDFFDGKIAELVFYSRLLSDEERQQVESYLNAKWNVY